MKKTNNIHSILIAEDDPDDQLSIGDAIEKSHISCKLNYVQNGDSLISYLRERGKSQKNGSDPFPDLILLDLNMPGMDGRQALKEIKSDNRLKAIPVVVLTISRSQEDIIDSYNTGANSFITKPDSVDAWVRTVNTLTTYWFESVLLPDYRFTGLK